MFARSLHASEGQRPEFTQTLEREVSSPASKQKGFRDESLYAPGGKKHRISLWDQAENAEAYNRELTPKCEGSGEGD